jgi:hypothetical protein
MTNKQINIAIAEACGWNPPPEGMGNITHGGGKFMSSEEWRKAHIPKYCNDLNAMHEAEKWVSEKCKEGDYWFFLRELLDFPEAESDWDKFYFFAAIHATARQRAEAFLKTIGKWEDAK